MDTDSTRSPYRRRNLIAGVVAAAGLALAIPASGALAGGGSTESGATDSAATPGFVQEQEGGQPDRPDGRGDRGDCPEHERGGEPGAEPGQGSSGGTFDESQEL
jgi:hypothetical protein